MLLLAGFFWASANLTAKAASGTGGQNSALGLVVWSSLFSPLPLLALSLAFEGTAAISASLRSITILTIGAILFLAVLSTLVGYGIWNALIMRYGASRIAPFSLLVPIFGLSSASVLLGERFTALDGVAAALVLGGLGVHLFWPLRKPVS
jgi:O-acetylserine/cysteine efflux transporter